MSGKSALSTVAPGAHSAYLAHRTKSLRSLTITSKGFQFLLEDVNTQLWSLLLRYLEEAKVSPTSSVARSTLLTVLSPTGHCGSPGILVHAGITRVGTGGSRDCVLFCDVQADLVTTQGYSTENLSETELSVLRDLTDYGLVYQPSVSLSIVFPPPPRCFDLC